MTYGNPIDLMILLLNPITCFVVAWHYMQHPPKHIIRRIGAAVLMIGLAFQAYISGSRFFIHELPEIWFFWALKDLGAFVLALGLLIEGGGYDKVK